MERLALWGGIGQVCIRYKLSAEYRLAPSSANPKKWEEMTELNEKHSSKILLLLLVEEDWSYLTRAIWNGSNLKNVFLISDFVPLKKL